jgi:flagellar basal-body rod protein FlgG
MYSAAAGMAAQQQRLDALSNDLANMNTVGYKRVRVAFRDLLYTPTGAGAARGVASGAGAAAVQIGRGSAQGGLQRTEDKLDVAISGSGFMQVRDAQGRVALTRDGALTRDSDGRLMTTTGAWTGITIPRDIDDQDIGIDANGRVNVDGKDLGRLRLVTVRAPEYLQAIGGNLFRPTAESGNPIAAGRETTLSQGVLEASNVSVADAMTEMLETQRAYQMGSRALSTQDRLLEIANGIKR